MQFIIVFAYVLSLSEPILDSSEALDVLDRKMLTPFVGMSEVARKVEIEVKTGDAQLCRMYSCLWFDFIVSVSLVRITPFPMVSSMAGLGSQLYISKDPWAFLPAHVLPRLTLGAEDANQRIPDLVSVNLRPANFFDVAEPPNKNVAVCLETNEFPRINRKKKA
ncbi:hypothetical protein K438DRAFT_1759964 [Mycena galopus ATCC 62051]|nr:hypothetical protein K438DRAFT_1759964 [Mycena galopus ATCC 62051]